MEFQMLDQEFWYGGAVYEGYRQPVGMKDCVEWDFRENPTANQLMPLFLSSKGRYLWSEEGGAVYEGYRQPVGMKDCVEWDFRENPTANQLMPLFLSSKGRYLWSEEGFLIRFHEGKVTVEGNGKIELQEGFQDLRGAYLAAMKAHFPFHEIRLSNRFFEAPVYNTWIELTFYQAQDKVQDLRGAYLAAMKAHFPFHEIRLSNRFFEAPVYNTWIELTFYQAQDKVLEYARGILEHGLEPGILMIDDGWSPYYGKWEFRRDNFPDPEAMLRELHDMEVRNLEEIIFQIQKLC